MDGIWGEQTQEVGGTEDTKLKICAWKVALRGSRMLSTTPANASPDPQPQTTDDNCTVLESFSQDRFPPSCFDSSGYPTSLSEPYETLQPIKINQLATDN